MTMQQEQFSNGRNNKGLARISVIIGIFMLALWLFPILGFPAGIAGLVLAIIGYQSPGKEYARAGIFLNGLGLFMGLINMIVSLYLLMNEGFDPFEFM